MVLGRRVVVGGGTSSIESKEWTSKMGCRFVDVSPWLTGMVAQKPLKKKMGEKMELLRKNHKKEAKFNRLEVSDPNDLPTILPLNPRSRRASRSPRPLQLLSAQRLFLGVLAYTNARKS